MKTLLLITGLLLTTASYSKVDTLLPVSNITNVTVFFNGAQVSRQANLKLTKGKHLLFFDQLPQEINPSSIQVKGVDQVQILSVKHQYNYKDQGRKSIQEKAAFDKVDSIKLLQERLRERISVFGIEERILLENSKIYQGKQGTTVQKLSEAADFYRERLNLIRTNKQNLKQEIKLLQKRLEITFKKINELTVGKRKTYSQLLMIIDCKKDISKPLIFSYYVPSAGWEPLYDFRVKDISTPLSIVYNANVFQSSGEDWSDVNIVLSSNNPLLSGSKPSMQSLYLGKHKQTIYRTYENGKATLTGRVFDYKTGEALAFCNVGIYQDNREVRSTVSDLNGMYTIKPIPTGKYTVKASYLGFVTKEKTNISLKDQQVALQDFALEQGVALNGIKARYIHPTYEKDQTTSGATRSRVEIERLAVRSVSDITKTAGSGIYSRGVGPISSVNTILGPNRNYRNQSTPEKKEATNFISNSLKHNITHLEYDIQIPYTILSDGEDYSLQIKEVKLDVDYVYYAVPKLDKDAFLTAKLPNWNELDLLSGKASIYYEGTFTNQSYLDVQSAADTLAISLGRDKGISISRIGDKEIYDKKKNGKTIKETLGWEINIRNNKTAPVTLIVEDQFPLSDRKSIEVDLLETNTGNLDRKLGTISWNLNLAPQEKKIIRFNYSVNYPKYSNLVVE